MSASGDHALRVESGPGAEYALSGKIMFSAIVILFAAVVFMAGLHLYARCYVARVRRRQLERRRALRRASRSQIVTYIDSRLPADRGLDGAVLSSLPVFMYALPEGDQAPPPECAVCISEFEEREVGRVLPTCGHSFHIECIDMWFRSHSTCPLCRSPVEHLVRRPSRPPGGVADEAGTGPSSGSADLCGPGKGPDVKIDVPENELVQESPASTPAETGEVDLESGPSQSNRVRTPMS